MKELNDIIQRINKEHESAVNNYKQQKRPSYYIGYADGLEKAYDIINEYLDNKVTNIRDIRWHKFPEEKPEKDGTYIVAYAYESTFTGEVGASRLQFDEYREKTGFDGLCDYDADGYDPDGYTYVTCEWMEFPEYAPEEKDRRSVSKNRLKWEESSSDPSVYRCLGKVYEEGPFLLLVKEKDEEYYKIFDDDFDPKNPWLGENVIAWTYIPEPECFRKEHEREERRLGRARKKKEK